MSSTKLPPTEIYTPDFILLDRAEREEEAGDVQLAQGSDVFHVDALEDPLDRPALDALLASYLAADGQAPGAPVEPAPGGVDADEPPPPPRSRSRDDR